MLLSNLLKKREKIIPDKNNNIEITIILKRIEKPMYTYSAKEWNGIENEHDEIERRLTNQTKPGRTEQ